MIRFAPQWLTEFAKTTFGVADKPILLNWAPPPSSRRTDNWLHLLLAVAMIGLGVLLGRTRGARTA